MPLHRPGFLDYPGWYGCGLVLDVVEKSRRWFLAGLLDWADTMPPTAESVARCPLLDQTITHTGGMQGGLLGALDPGGAEPLLWLDCSEGNHKNPHHRPSLMRGLKELREATAPEHEDLQRRGRVWTLSPSLEAGYRTRDQIERHIQQKLLRGP